MDLVWFTDFNAVALAAFFAQVRIVYEQKSFKNPYQICNLGETAFTPGELLGQRNIRIRTETNNHAIFPRVEF